MIRFLNRRTLGLLGLVVATQLVTGCVVVPAHHARHGGPVVVDVTPAYRSHHHHERYRDDRRDGYRGGGNDRRGDYRDYRDNRH